MEGKKNPGVCVPLFSVETAQRWLVKTSRTTSPNQRALERLLGKAHSITRSKVSAKDDILVDENAIPPTVKDVILGDFLMNSGQKTFF